jgi:multimeric flavodoxin WrbA
MILGINASARPEKYWEGKLTSGTTEKMMKYILEKTGEPYEYVTLGDKTILGCRGCCLCAGDNVCVVDDDWAEIKDKMFQADAVVFGAPNYYGVINAIGHAFLERTFSLRHRERFPLAGKLNAIITSDGGDPNPVEQYIRKMFRSNYMAEPIGVLKVPGVSQCYTCGYGRDCAAGSVVSKHGMLDDILPEQVPVIPEEVYDQAYNLAHRLGNVVRANK